MLPAAVERDDCLRQRTCASTGGDSVKATLSRGQVLAAAAVTPTATLAANETHWSQFSAADPVFAAIEQHRQAVQALSAAYQLPDAILDQRQRAEEDALLAWL